MVFFSDDLKLNLAKKLYENTKMSVLGVCGDLEYVTILKIVEYSASGKTFKAETDHAFYTIIHLQEKYVFDKFFTAARNKELGGYDAEVI